MFSTMTKPLVLLCVVHAISLVSVTAAPHRLQKRTLVDRKLADPLISGWVAAWKGQVAADIYHQYNELSFFSAVIDNTNLSVAWSVDGGPEKVFTDGYIEKNYETQPILLSIGGWTGSKSFSGAVATDDRRKALAEKIAEIVVQYRFSGVDLDWEFPNAVGKDEKDFPGDVGGVCNQHSPEDSDNLYHFIKVLRTTLETRMHKDPFYKYNPIIAAAVPFSGFRGRDGTVEQDRSRYVEDGALDYISIMAYEMGHAYRKHSGIHAPWDLGPKTPDDQKWSILASIKNWTDAKVPADKIQVGLASYGKTLNTTVPKNTEAPPANKDFDSPLYQKQDLPEILEQPPAGWEAKWDNPLYAVWGREYCDVTRVRKNTQGLSFNETIAAGMITPDGDNAVAPWKYFWDNTAHSPYLWNPLTSQMVTYDSPKSIQIKAEKIARFRDKNGKNLLGVKIFHVQGDAIEADKKEGRLVSAAIKGFKVEGSRGGSP